MEKILLLLIIIVLCYYLYVTLNTNESFTQDIDDVIKIDPKKIVTMLPFFDKNGYIACYIDENNQDTNNLIYTNEIKSNNWKGPMKNGKLNDRSVIIDMIYDIDKSIIGVGMEMVSNKPVYTLYKKETEDPESNWNVMMSNSKTIRSVCYDYNGTLLGISSFDGQIYEYQAGYWVGPVNYDKPMKKIMFDKDHIMLGIGLLDSKIYKKKTLEWKKSKWDTENNNKNRVFDIVFDSDGKLIASSKHGIMKQYHPIYNSDFDLLEKIIDEDNELLTKLDIIGLKCGIDFEQYGYLEEDDELSKNLNNVLRFKKRALGVCSNKRQSMTNINPKQLLKQNENQNLINEIDNVVSELKSKGF